MKFGPVPVPDAEGAILAHSVVAGEVRFGKAHRLTSSELDQLAAAGVATVIVARPAAGDVLEDEAAERLAASLGIECIEIKAPSTGRVNLHAKTAGVFTVDAALVDALNALDPAITLATLGHHAPVVEGQMVATVKIIPFAVDGALLERACALSAERPAMAVHAFRALRVGLVQTTLPSVRNKVLDKTARVTAERLSRSGSRIMRELRVPHRAEDVAKALEELAPDADLLLVFGASAMTDPADVIPAAIGDAGGSVQRVGMPVDPGNLLVLGRLNAKPVIGAPGCARSPKLNGFDWVLDRLSAGLDVKSADIARMGVGGLLMEIPSRPQPREGKKQPKLDVAGILLAAGRSSRMGGTNKLRATFDGMPLIRRSAERLVGADLGSAVVVLGNQAENFSGLLRDIDVQTVVNEDFATGLASSLRAGISQVPASSAGVLIALADMPAITTRHYNRMIDAFREQSGEAIVRAAAGEKRGNPVILPRSLFARIDQLEGDTGARHLIESAGIEVIDVDIGEAALIDVDTPEAMAAAGGVIEPAEA